MLAAAIFASPHSEQSDMVPAAVSRIVTPQGTGNTTSSSFPSVGIVGDTRGGFCSGTLISSEFVLTAAHCADDVANTSGRFNINGTTYGTSQVIVHPSYNINRLGTDQANDIALYKLSRPVTDVAASPIYRSTPRVGETLTLVGFGGGRASNGGADGTFGTKRSGTTPIDRVSQTIVGWRYDNASESNTAPGDSGGPAFLNVGGVYYVAGVTSGGTSVNSAIGDNSFDTRVDAYKSWIDSIVGSTGTPTPTPTPSPQPVPQPSPELPTVSIRATDANAGERRSSQSSNRGEFVISRTGSTSAALTVSLAIAGSATNGVDYGTVPSSITIPARVSSVRVRFTPRDDSIVEGTETAIFTVNASAAYNTNASLRSSTIVIADNDVARSNDSFANRQTITGTGVIVTGTSISATRESGEPSAASVPGGKSIWYSWKAPSSGTVTLATSGSDFDTTLGVYTGTQLSRLRLVTGNDDENLAAGQLTSRASFTATKGTTYQILVDGYNGTGGQVQLSLSQAGRSRSSEIVVNNVSKYFAAPPITTTPPVVTTSSSTNANRDFLFALLAR